MKKIAQLSLFGFIILALFLFNKVYFSENDKNITEPKITKKQSVEKNEKLHGLNVQSLSESTSPVGFSKTRITLSLVRMIIKESRAITSKNSPSTAVR